MQLSKLTRVGVITFTLGAALSVGWTIWHESRITTPVNIPVTLKPGHVRTREFKVNSHQTYIIELEVAKRLPFDELNCLLGASIDPGKQCDKSAVVNAKWVLTTGGKIVAEGASSDTSDAGWSDETIDRWLGSFEGEAGRLYILDVEFLTDGQTLAVTDPHLKVDEPSESYEDGIVGALVVFWPGVLIAVVGIFLLLTSAIRPWWRKKRLAGV
jgi:hypothetical protein